MNNLEELREHCEEMMPLRYAYIPASSIITLIERIEKAEAELSAANEKLNNPVEFPDCDISAVSHIAHWYSEKQCEAWVAGVEFSKKQIKAAGFTVEGE
ncbi:TPA: hypothetical protein PXM15_000967 [Yersinia enterocolitica]|nr:hypothetical protein [Yersinia enterocolitica]